MATIPNFGTWIAPRVHRATWLDLGQGDSGAAYSGSWISDKSVQVTGNFSAAAACTIEGSNDGGTTWKVLTDFQGNPLIFSAASMEQIAENPVDMRPTISNGDGSTSINVYIVGQGAKS